MLSGASVRHAASTAAAPATGLFSDNLTKFTYATPTGGKAVIQLVGLGNLANTTVNGAGELNLVFNGTNAYSKIISHVKGGDGRAPLASILNGQLVAAGAANSISGVGGNVIQAVYLKSFDLIADGQINLTSGVNTLVLDSIGPGTQVQLRELPPPPSTSTSTSSVASLELVSTTGTTSTSSLRVVNTGETPSGSSSGSSSTSGTTLMAEQSTSVTNDGITTSYGTDGKGGQTLTGITGTFTPSTNIVESLPAGQPAQTPPPAPPGVILKIAHVDGDTDGPVNLLTDPKIFGYDPTTGQVLRFDLNLEKNTGAVDPTFTPISVAGDPSSVGLNLGYKGSELLVLVGDGTTVYAYNATTGAPVGSFTTSEPVNGIGSTNTVTVLASYATNQLTMINLAASLEAKTAEAAPGKPAAFTPAAGITLLGGVTGSTASSTTISAAIGATFDSYTPTQPVFGLQSLGTVTVVKNSELTYRFTPGSPAGITQNGMYSPVQVNPPIATQLGAALGSIDQSLALVTGASNGNNKITTSFGTVTLDYSDLLTGLSEAFRADLGSSALIDIQGDVQSVRGTSATGMVLNDNGNLNLLKFDSVSNSTIVGQPFSHLNVQHRSHVTVLTPSRTVGDRGAVTVDRKLQPIGTLSQTNDE
jgi:hypothetical protein